MVNEKVTDIFISKLLDKSNIKHHPNGSNIKEVEDALKTASKRGTGNTGFPEFTAKVKDFLLVIEDKAETKMNELYLDESSTTLDMSTDAIVKYAVNGALFYSKIINEKTNFKKIFAFGCSGDEKKHKIQPIFLKNHEEYEILPEVENFENFSEENIEKYYRERILKETPDEILEINELKKKSEELHEYLRNYGQLRETENPIVVSAILLALDEKLNLDDLNGERLLNKKDGVKIYELVKSKLYRLDVPEDKRDKILNEFSIIKNSEKLNTFDEYLDGTPIKYFTGYIKKHIYPTLLHSTSEDILGHFYGEFVRYSGGDGQNLGVVLTPSHITELFTELLDIKPSDKIIDPCCGTGSFLIAGLHKMLEETSDRDEKLEIKRHRIHGIEIRPDMFTIATTNMILRGDGKSNLKNTDFLKQDPKELQKEKYTVGMMNPPYGQRKNSETAYLSEIHFVKHLLDSLDDTEGSRCAVIIPISAVTGKNPEDKEIKKEILKKHTLEGVITLNTNTFGSAASTNPCIAIFTPHKPHDSNKYCKFINFEDDGFEFIKQSGLVETERAKEKKQHLLDCWLNDAPSESKFMVKSQIEHSDEWIHSFYYFNDDIPSNEDFEETINNYMTFEFEQIMNNREYLFKED